MGKKAASRSEPSQAAQAAQDAMNRRSTKKKPKSQASQTVWIVVGVAFCILTVFLAATGGSGSSRGGQAVSKLDSQVNDHYFIRDTNNNADGNFTASASPFFNRWTYADLKWGMSGVQLSRMVGMPGAIQRCDEEKDVEGGALPSQYDARVAFPNCFSAVYDSGNCTSSYAIAAAATVASRYCIADNAKHSALKLSPQQILSCDKKSKGCTGGMADGVWAYIKRRGLYPEHCVPYAGSKGAECKTDCSEDNKLQILDYCVKPGDVKGIKRELFNRGPLHAPMTLTDEFLVYKEGIFTPTRKGNPVYDAAGKPIVHVVTLVGWGKSEGQPYWVIGNSWGDGWGEQGYARVAVGSVLEENYLIVATPATEENKAEQARKVAEDAAKQAELKKEREERNARIAAREAQQAAEKAAQESDEDDPDLDVDLDDIDVDPELSDEPDEVNIDAEEM